MTGMFGSKLTENMSIEQKRLFIGVCGGQWGDGGVGKTTVINILAKHMGFYPASFSSPVRDIAKKSFGWDGKMNSQSRDLLDQICRKGKLISEHYWLNLAMAGIPSEANKVAIDDLWFDDEAAMIEKCGGFVLRITRPGHSHIPISCSAIEVANDGNLVQLQRKVLWAVTQATE